MVPRGINTSNGERDTINAGPEGRLSGVVEVCVGDARPFSMQVTVLLQTQEEQSYEQMNLQLSIVGI